MIWRAIVLSILVLISEAIRAVVVGWLANRRDASWVHVAGFTNFVILTAVVFAIDEFRGRGLTLYTAFYSMLMFWLAYRAARGGVIGFAAIKANRLWNQPELRR